MTDLTVTRPVINVREEAHPDVLERVETALAVRLDRASVVYGESGATEGFRTNAGTWVRIERRGATRFAAAWVGLEAASVIEGVTKPRWFQSVTWADPGRGVVWRADELELITAPMVGELRTAALMPDVWWSGLRASLAALATHQTQRVGMSQAHVTRRIIEMFGDDVNTRVDEWVTAHTDVHWHNLSVQGHLIDWEDWGTAPRGLDAACLWQASLRDVDLAARVRREFAADLDTRSGTLSMLVQCANVIRGAARRGNETSLSHAARAASTGLLAALADL
ncbi:hypothetical protein [Actinophytocola sp.]|uniref:hypothetical protein n=1 Tax=Actinophytocola sp. TaxID=1872138 RepID=UPI003D6A9324